jgi:tetratricopeptide (TPR) repeat protein
MQGMVLNALGDLFTRMGQPAKAKDWYEMAVVPAAECSNPILLSTLVRNLGDTQYALGNYTEARGYFVELDRVSTHLCDAETKSTALLSQGRCERALGKRADAIRSFETGATLCRGTGQPQGLRQHLEQLHDIYSSEGMSGKAQLVAEEINRADADSGAS